MPRQLGLVEDVHREIERQRRHHLGSRLGRKLPQRFGNIRCAELAERLLQLLWIAVDEVEQLCDGVRSDLNHLN